eukprot:scaffold105816_cov32-Phaeocystis_antarctica.AAC.1
MPGGVIRRLQSGRRLGDCSEGLEPGMRRHLRASELARAQPVRRGTGAAPRPHHLVEAAADPLQVDGPQSSLNVQPLRRVAASPPSPSTTA